MQIVEHKRYVVQYLALGDKLLCASPMLMRNEVPKFLHWLAREERTLVEIRETTTVIRLVPAEEFLNLTEPPKLD